MHRDRPCNTKNKKILNNRFIVSQRSKLLALLMTTISGVQADPIEQDYFSFSLKELSEIKVITSSKREQSVIESYANVSVITKAMIERRGYRNIIEVLEDLPGFDFSTFEDGGGEYPVHNLNRGIGGDNGNSRMMVMIDGLVQNHISFNWAQGLTDEQMLIDIERIEVVQGPGSALYGAQAVSGIIHIITKSKYNGVNLKLLMGQHNTKALEIMYGDSVGDLFYQMAFKNYLSDGDAGFGRPDPGGYFSGNLYPDFLTADYDSDGNYLTNVANPLAGQPIPDGFNNAKDDKNLRIKIAENNFEVGINYWEKKDGLGSYVVAYEYRATEPDFITHHTGLTAYAKNKKNIIQNYLEWNSDFWYREDTQKADTGFRYTYRFSDYKKSYHGSSNQVGLENQLNWKLENDKTLIVGVRLLKNRQAEQVVSLGELQNGNASTTNSSWDIAVTGGGLGQKKVNEVFDETETAIYALLEGKLSDNLSYSIGNRYSDGSDYGTTVTPRLGLIYSMQNNWVLKSLYGSAFRQPSLFELRDEFRGQINLVPENIDTYELEINKTVTDIANLKFNIFYSSLTDSISLVSDPSRAGGESYANLQSSKVRGWSTQIDLKPTDSLSIYVNYMYQQGAIDGEAWGKLAHTAQHKLNLGMNWLPFGSDFIINLRGNYVGKRKTPETNTYFDGFAPGYTKLDLVFTWVNLLDKKGLNSQVIINNLFDESYFGVGRQSGSSLSSDYDPSINPDPAGFIPAYHPQAGRMIYWNLSYNL